MNEVKLYAGALAVLLVGAYLSFSKKEEATTSDAVTIVETTKDKLEKIELVTKTQTVAVSFRELDGQRYPWFEVDVRKRKRAFAGNEEVDKLLESFAPFKALRTLGKGLSDKEVEQTGLKKIERKLAITANGSRRDFDVGARTQGSRDHYVRPKGSNEIFLVASKVLADLEFPEGRFMQRKLRVAKLADVEKLSIAAKGKTKVAVQKNRQGGKDAFWASEASEEKNETLANYVDKLEKLTATDYLEDEKAAAAATTVLEVSWFGEADKSLGTMKLLRKGEGRDSEYYAVSTATRLPVKVSRFTSDQIEKDLDGILGQ